jgi:DNA-binding HxlR family transcriptional regulator
MAAAKRKIQAGTPPNAKTAGPCESTDVGCQIGDLFRLLGKAHMLDILYILNVEAEGQPRRFVDLQKELKISPNTLSDRLRELVEAGLLTRTAYNEIPPRVDYQTTTKAKDLGEVFESLRAWAGKHNLKPMPAPEPIPVAKA